MATDPLRAALEQKLTPRYVRQLIADKASKHALTPHEALLAVARDRGITTWTKYASSEELVSLRNLAAGTVATATPAPSASASATPARGSPATRGAAIRHGQADGTP